MTGVRVGVSAGVSVGISVVVSVGVCALLIPFRLVEFRIKIKAQIMLLATDIFIFMILIPFYDFIYRKGIIREPDNFIRFRNKVDIVIHHITSISWRIE